MQESELALDLCLDELPEPHRSLAECIGVEAMIKLVKQYGGCYQYIPKGDALFRMARDKGIKKEYNGYNIPALARKYQISENHVRRLLDESTLDEGQTSLFGTIE